MGAKGANGTARAYGLVSAAGVVDPTRTFNATVRKLTSIPGEYCITSGPGINPATVAPQLTIDFTTGGDADALAQFGSGSTRCKATEFGVLTRTASTGGLADEGFTFLVP